MELEVYENLTKNSTFDPQSNYTIPVNYHLEIPLLVIALSSAFANGLIITTVVTFPILHTRLYYYLTSWSVCNLVIILSVPYTMNLFGFIDAISGMVYCTWAGAGLVFMLGDLIFIGIISLDWYILTFSGQNACVGRCRRQQKLILATTWTIILFLIILTTTSCQVRFTVSISVLVYVVGYLTVLTMIIVLLFLRMVKLKTSSVVVEKTNLESKLILAYLMCWLPNMLGIVSVFMILPDDFIEIEYVTYMISHSNASVFLVLLYFNDMNFKVSLRTLLKLKTYRDEGTREADNTFFIEKYPSRD